MSLLSSSICICWLLLPGLVPTSIHTIYLKAGCAWLQRHIPHTNLLCKAKVYLKRALFQIILWTNLFYAWKPEVFLWFQHAEKKTNKHAKCNRGSLISLFKEVGSPSTFTQEARWESWSNLASSVSRTPTLNFWHLVHVVFWSSN